MHAKDPVAALRLANERFQKHRHLVEKGETRIYGLTEDDWKTNMVTSSDHFFDGVGNTQALKDERYSVSYLRSMHLRSEGELNQNWLYEIEIAIVDASSRVDALEKAKKELGLDNLPSEDIETRMYVVREKEWLGTRIFPPDPKNTAS